MKPCWIDDLWVQVGVQIASLDVKLFDLHNFFNKQTEKLENFRVDPNIFFLGFAYCCSACKFWLLYFYGVETQVPDLSDLIGGCGQVGIGLFSQTSRDTMRGSGLRRCQRRFRLGFEINFYTGRVVKHWHEMPGEVVKSASVKVFKKWLVMALDTVVSSQKLDSVVSGSFPASMILWNEGL